MTDGIDRKPSQAVRRAELLEKEGCILCRVNAETKRYYLRAKPKDMIYHKTPRGDYLLCPWHDTMIVANWYGSSDRLKKMIELYLRENR